MKREVESFDSSVFDLNALDSLARAHQGTCLATSETLARKPVIWRCHANHEFPMTPYRVSKGGWCPICKPKPGISRRYASITMERIHEHARSKSGKCLSDVYIPGKKLKWKCAKHHVWECRAEGPLLNGSWCPVCSNRARYSINNGIIASRTFLTIPRQKFEEILSYARSMQRSLDKKQIIDALGDRYFNDFSLLINCLLKSSAKPHIYITEKDIESIDMLLNENLVYQFDGHGERLVSSDELKKIIGNRKKISSSAVKRENNNEYIKLNNSIVISDKKFTEITTFITSLGACDERRISTEVMKKFGDSFGTIIAHLKGRHDDHDFILVTPGDLSDMDGLLRISTNALKRGEGSIKLIRKPFYQEFMQNFKAFQEKFHDIDDRDFIPFYARLASKKNPEMQPFTLKGWLRGSVPNVYDPFDEASNIGYPWMLGCMLSETGLVGSRYKNIMVFKLGSLNPLAFFDHLIPQVRHPSFSHNDFTLSPELVDFLRTKGGLDDSLGRHPVDTSSLELFLAGLCDSRCSVMLFHVKNSDRLQAARLLIQLPINCFEEWLKFIPFKLPLVVSGGLSISEGIRRHYAPSEYMSDHQYAVAFISSRRPPELLYPDNQDAAEMMVEATKYFFERVFPNSIHPRLKLYLEAGEYFNEHYGNSNGGLVYPRKFREVLLNSGAIDLTKLLETINNPLIDPDTGEILMYKPPWIDAMNDTLGTDDKDLIESWKRAGGFIPFKV